MVIGVNILQTQNNDNRNKSNQSMLLPGGSSAVSYGMCEYEIEGNETPVNETNGMILIPYG